jgi:hypothetical protein
MSMSFVCHCGVVLRHRYNFFLEGSGLLGCDTLSFNEVVLNISKECSTFIFRGQAVQEVFLDCLTPENEGIMFLGNVWNYLPNTVSHPRTPQQHCHENIRSCSCIITIKYFISTVNIMSAMCCSRTFNMNKTVDICGPKV